MYCADCGKKIKEDSLYCAHCGSSIKEKPSNEPQPLNIIDKEEERYDISENNDTESPSGWNLFSVERNPALESKAWFRFIKVLQGIAIVVVILVSLLTAYLLFDSKSLSTATLVCNDGTTWNAMDPNYTTLELDTYEKCGLCNRRLKNNTYYKCEYSESYQKLHNSYTVNRTYDKDHSIFAVLGWTSLVFFGGLLLVKVTAKIIVYIFGGNSNV